MWIYLAGAAILLGLALWNTTERFQPEFIDKTSVRRTVQTMDSSYAQQTNHMSPPRSASGETPGVQSPFQVNQYKAYIQ